MKGEDKETKENSMNKNKMYLPNKTKRDNTGKSNENVK